jgi:hypothetical protein
MMKKQISKLILSIIGVTVIALFVMPSVGSALTVPPVFPTGYWASDGLVPSDHSFCGLIQAVVNIIYFAITILFFLLIPIYIMYGGFLMLTSMGSTEKVGEGKKAMTGAVIGAAIGLGAYLIINTFFGFVAQEMQATWTNPSGACEIPFFKSVAPSAQ